MWTNAKRIQRESQILPYFHRRIFALEVRFLHNKSGAIQAFKKFKALVERQTGRKIKSLQSDNGREFCNDDFDKFLREKGITRRLTTPYTPQSNGIAERKNRTLMEMARCMMMQSKLPVSFWAEAVATPNYIRNRCITNVLKEKTPFEMWHGKCPDVSHLWTFGETAYMLDKIPGKSKLDPRGIQCIFLGYDETSKGFRVRVPSKQKVTITRDIKFLNITLPVEEPMNSINMELTDCEITVDLGDTPVLHEFYEDPKESENELDIPAEGSEDESHIIDNTGNRGPGRPRKLLTGRRGRPRKVYQPQQGREHNTESVEEDVVQDSDHEVSPGVIDA